MGTNEQQIAGLKQVETDMLREFIAACDKLKLRYYLLGGTLLGAVRHKGFIPWDDDIDVGMPRADYEIFLEKGQALLPKHLFVQCLKSEPEYPLCFAKIRDSRTTFVETAINNLNINHGVYIDIFPLDYYPEEKRAQKRLNKKHEAYKRRISVMFNSGKKSLKIRLMSLLWCVRYPSVRKVIAMRDALYHSVPESKVLANYCGAWGAKEIMPAAWYGEGTPVVFEGMEVVAPVQYHNWLTQVYGDYMQLPPVEKRVGHHYADVIDLRKSYTEYVRRKG